MKRLFLAFVLITFAITGFAQNGPCSIKGRAVDSLTKKPIENAFVTLYQSGKDAPLVQLITDNKGTIALTGLSAGKYKVTIVLMGYKPWVKDSITLSTQQPMAVLGDILIRSTSQTLKDVTVSGLANLVENKPDMIVYHADKDITNSGGVALDVLKKVPEVTVDNQGNVELQGNSDVVILINGKTSPGLTGSLTDALQAIPADEIDHIEVMTTPPAQYDAQGMGGIINIVLKKSLSPGITGSVNVASGTRLNKGSFNLSYRTDKWQLSGNFNTTYFIPQNSTSTASRVLTSNDTTYTFNQTSSGTVGRHNYMGGLGFDWDITKNDNLTIHVGYKLFSHSSDMNTVTTTGITEENSSQVVTGSSNLPYYEYAPGGSLDYIHKFDTLGTQLEFTVNYWGDNNVNYNGISQSLTSSSTPVDANSYLLKEMDTSKGLENNIEIGTGFIKPFNKDTKLELGVKMTMYTINSTYNYDVYDTSTNAYVFSTLRSNGFDYTQNIPAAYASFSFKPISDYTVKLGLRYEYTFNHSDLVDNNSIYNQQYDNLLPTIMVMRKFGMQTLKATYSYRLERAEYDRLDPLVNISDQNTISLGNPYMVSEKQQKVDLSYSLSTNSGAAFTATIYYRGQNDDIYTYTSIYPQYIIGTDTLRNVSVTEPYNAMTKNSYGLSVYGSVNLFKNLQIRLNANYTHDNMIILLYSAPAVNAYRYNINFNASYNFPFDILVEAFGMFNSPRFSFQGELPSYSEYSFGIRKQFNHKKISVGLIAVNPFTEYHYFITNISGPGFTQQSTLQVPAESYGITFSYLFGNPVKKDKEEIPEPTDSGALGN